jgi:DNA-binding NarL/FixJ family response regulator
LLGLAPATVKKHVHDLVQKTGDSSLNGAVQRALLEALVRQQTFTP